MTSSHSNQRAGAVSPLALLILCASLSLSGLLVWKGLDSRDVPTKAADSTVASSVSMPVDDQPQTRLKPIEAIQVGDRVAGEQPLGETDESLGLDVDPRTWKTLTLKAPKEDGSWADVTLLRPDWWLEQRPA